MRRTWLGIALTAAITAGISLVACSNGANNVAGCQQIENARCTRASACGIDLSFPLHTGGSAEDGIQACQLFYQDACLHGLVTPVTVPGPMIADCTNAILTGSCDTVVNPQNTAACSWLNPPDAGVDAGTDAVVDVTTVLIDSYVPPIVDATVVLDSSCDLSCESMCSPGDTVCISQICGC
jgi:hypothetical protein